MFSATQQAIAQSSSNTPATAMDMLAQKAEAEANEQAESSGLKRKFISGSNNTYQSEDSREEPERENKIPRNAEEIDI